MAGDSETGVSIMHMDAGLDTGPVYATRKCPISDTTDGPTLEAQLAESGATLLLECLNDLDKREPKAQAESWATYAKKLSKADATVDWNLDAVVIDRQIRALCGRQPATVVLGNLRIKLLKARANSDTAPGAAPGTIVRSGRDGIIVACASGSITLLRVQLNTGKGSALDPLAACNGYPETFSPGASLASNH
jgi:methionyl-tRNA formyltransferase